jgi:capsular polysaccharide biosynthesis protein/Mrp family chromosome partitioning ATPase
MNGAEQTNSNGSPHPPGQEGRRSRGSVLLGTLLRAGLPIVLVTLLAAYAAYTYTARQPTVYEASAEVVLSASNRFSPLPNSPTGAEDRYVQNQANIMTTLPVLDRAAALLADGIPGGELRGQVRAESAGANEVIVITAQSGEPAQAAARADAVANAYAQFTAAEVQVLAEQAAQAAVADPVQVRDIRARAAIFGDGVAVIQPATAPSEPVLPTPGRNAYLVAAAVFLLTTGLALTWRGSRRPVRPDDLAAEAGGPLLGEVPVRWFGSAAVPQQPGHDRYALALQALRYRLRDAEDGSVLLTSVGRDRSSTSALLGLAAAEAAQGRRVVLLDATDDGRLLRRAGATPPAVSLTTLVAGGDNLGAALEPVPALSGQHGGSVRIARIERSPVTSVGALRPSLTTLLASADLVLVDAGPAVHDATAYALLGEVGAVVAVVRTRYRGGELNELRRRLALAGRECDGVLVTHRTWLPSLGTPATPTVLPGTSGPTALRAPLPAAHGTQATAASAATLRRH